jgi:ribonucleotide monophosphatase NagD (HAD superfamily)
MIGRFAQDLAPFQTAVGSSNNDIATMLVRSGIHHEESAHQTASDNVPGHTESGQEEEWQTGIPAWFITGL